MVFANIANKEVKGIIAPRLRAIMHQRNIDVDTLAYHIGFSPQAVKSWCNPNNEKLPSYTAIARLCKALRISADVLMGLDELVIDEPTASPYEWIEQLPHNPNDSDIKKGIEFFKHLVIDCKPAGLLSDDWQSLCYAFRVATLSGGLRITHVAEDKERQTLLRKLLPFPSRLKAYPHKIYVAKLPQLEDGGFIQGTIIRTELVSVLAAKYIFGAAGNALPSRSWGIGPGFTVLRCAELVPPTATEFAGTRWIPLMAIRNPARDIYAISANYTATVLASRHQQTQSLHLPFVSPQRREFEEPLYQDEYQAQTLENTLLYDPWTAGPIVMSVGGVFALDTHDKQVNDPDSAPTAFTSHTLQDAYQKLRDKSQFAGEALGMMLNSKGQIIEQIADINLREVYTPLTPERLGNVTYKRDVWAVAAGKHKCQPILNAIRNNLVNGLIIDSEIAQFLIDKLQENKSGELIRATSQQHFGNGHEEDLHIKEN